MVWVVSLTDYKLTPQSGLPDVYDDREFGVLQKARNFFPGISNRCSTSLSFSVEVMLRHVSRGTS